MPKRAIFIIVAFAALFPLAASAQGEMTPGYKMLVDLTGFVGGQVDLQTYLRGIFRMLIAVAGVLAVVMIVICGIKYMSSGDNSGTRTEARECIWNAIYGILIALGAWMLLNTINPLLLSDTIAVPALPAPGAAPVPAPGAPGGPGPVTEQEPTAPNQICYRYTDKGNIKNDCTPGVDERAMTACQNNARIHKSVDQPPIDATWDCKIIETPKYSISQDEKGARNRLCGNDTCVCNANGCVTAGVVRVNHLACKGSETSGCTNIAGLPDGTIDYIKSLAGIGGIIVTGGTEPDHHAGNNKPGSHSVGHATFDMDFVPGSNLEKTIKGDDYNRIGDAGGYVSFCGNRRWKHGDYWWTDEKYGTRKRHWHVCGPQENVFYCQEPPNPDRPPTKQCGVK